MLTRCKNRQVHVAGSRDVNKVSVTSELPWKCSRRVKSAVRFCGCTVRRTPYDGPSWRELLSNYSSFFLVNVC